MGESRRSGPEGRLRVQVEVRRGPIAESRHSIQVAVAGADGAVHAATEHGDLVTSFRSSAKPFQLLPLVELGHAERFGLTDEHLAVMAGSHTGSAYHVGLVREILDRIGVGESALACGTHEPLDPESLTLLRVHPERQSALYNNCSGKHAGMLALARAEGWPLAGYERAEHPVQQRMRDTVADLCGVEPGALLVGIDGCSVSVFGAPLSCMARAYARLAAAHADGGVRERSLERIRRAMMRYPVAVGGAERLSTALMQAAPDTLVAKGGAEGLECVGVPARGIGVAVKCEDGRARGVEPAAIAVLEHLGLLQPEQAAKLGRWRRPELRNAAGLVVGEIHASVATLAGVTS